MSKAITNYVVYCCERMRDGQEEWAKVITGLDNALAYMNKIKDGFCGSNTTIELYELGKQIKVEETVVKEAVVTEKEKTQFKVK